MKDLSRRNILQFATLLALCPYSILAKADTDNFRALPEGLSQWHMPANGWVPNNPDLPVIHFHPEQYSGVNRLPLSQRLEQIQWSQQWEAKPFSYLHFHSTTHVIFIASKGRGNLQVGGENGKVLSINKGDVLFLPAGTGQRLIESSNDFAVQAFYPIGNHWDVCRSEVSADTLNTSRVRTLSAPARQLFNQLTLQV